MNFLITLNTHNVFDDFIFSNSHEILTMNSMILYLLFTLNTHNEFSNYTKYSQCIR